MDSVIPYPRARSLRATYLIWLVGAALLWPRGLAAQADSWQWLARTHIANNDAGNARPTATATDAAGNAYVTGNTYGRISFGPTVISNGGVPYYGPQTLFIAKLDAAGQWEWVVTAPSTDYVLGTGLAIDPLTGDVLVIGTVAGSCTLGDTTIQAPPQGAGFVARLSPQGRWQWVRPVRAGYGAQLSAIARDPRTNDFIVTGSYGGTLQLGDTPVLPGSGGAQTFVARLSSAGEWQWATRAGMWYGSRDTLPYCVAVAPDGGIAVGGEYPGLAAFGPDTLRGGDPRGGFVASMSPEGNWRWARTTGFGVGGVVADAGGEVAATGGYSLQFGPAIAGFPLTSARDSVNSLFVTQLDAAGRPQWVATAGGPTSYGAGTGLLREPASGHLILGALYRGTDFATTGSGALPADIGTNLLVARLSEHGAWLSTATATNPSFLSGARSTDPCLSLGPGTRHLTLAGAFRVRAQVGPYAITQAGFSSGEADLFVARLALGGLPTAGFSLFPNPVGPTGEVRLVRAPTDASATEAIVYDATGRRVLTVTFPAGAVGVTLAVGALARGVYLVHLGPDTRLLAVQ